MKNSLTMLFGELAEGDSRDIETRIRRFAENLGFCHTAYHLITVNNQGPLDIHFASYPEEWLSQYISDGMFFHDPVVQAATTAVTPFAWGELEKRFDLSAPAVNVLRGGEDFGLKGGISVPVRGPGDFALFSVCAEDYSERHALELMGRASLLAMFCHEAAREQMLPKNLKSAHSLSPREREVLTWVAAGKSSWDISKILKLSEKTVSGYVSAAMQKLKCGDRTQAVVRAMRMGLIEV